MLPTKSKCFKSTLLVSSAFSSEKGIKKVDEHVLVPSSELSLLAKTPHDPFNSFHVQIDEGGSRHHDIGCFHGFQDGLFFGNLIIRFVQTPQ
jgi:hypothetical protein